MIGKSVLLGVLALVATAASAQQSTRRDTSAAEFYSSGLTALGRQQYDEASRYFGRAAVLYGGTERGSQALYWSAFALNRQGQLEQLRTALVQIDTLKRRRLQSSLGSEVRQLELAVCGALTARGDPRCQDRVMAAVAVLTRPQEMPMRMVMSPRQVKSNTAQECRRDTSDQALRISAFAALRQMNPGEALAAAEKTFERPDPCTVTLRMQMIPIIATLKSDTVTRVLLRAVKSDPDAAVREVAVTWAVNRGADYPLLHEILNDVQDTAIQARALSVLQGDNRGQTESYIREFVLRDDIDDGLRVKGVTWLGRIPSAENVATLKKVYPRVKDLPSRRLVLDALARQHAFDEDNWILDVGLKNATTTEERSAVLFYAERGNLPSKQYVALYDRTPEHQLREDLIRGYERRADSVTVAKLVSIGLHDKDPQLRGLVIRWATQEQARQPADPQIVQFLVDLLEKQQSQ